MSSNLPVPEGIASSPYSDLAVKAKPTRDFMTPTTQQIPDAPQDNAMIQLARGLQVFNPALSNVAGQVVTEQERREVAEGLVAAQEAQKKNISDLKQAQAAGIIPSGASPNFIQAWKAKMKWGQK